MIFRLIVFRLRRPFLVGRVNDTSGRVGAMSVVLLNGGLSYISGGLSYISGRLSYKSGRLSGMKIQ